MGKTWILTLTLLGNSPAIESVHDFKTKEACLEYAKDWFKTLPEWYQEKTVRGEDKVTIVCGPDRV